jgi:hypothetical protein
MMKMRRILILIYLVEITVICSLGSAFAEESSLVSQIQRVKPSIVAIGTYFFKDTPSVQFRGTGFAVGNGTVIVTNAHTMDTARQKNKRIKCLKPLSIRLSSLADLEKHSSRPLSKDIWTGLTGSTGFIRFLHYLSGREAMNSIRLCRR